MNARINPTPAAELAPCVPRPTGRKPSAPRRLVMTELQHHARNMRFTPHTTPAGLSPQHLASATGVDLKTVRTTINNMQSAEQVVNAGTHNKPLWRLITPADTVRANTAPAQVTTSPYDGAELRPYTGRPGAMDAFNLPSLVNGQHVPAKRPTAMCVGALAERANKGRD